MKYTAFLILFAAALLLQYVLSTSADLTNSSTIATSANISDNASSCNSSNNSIIIRSVISAEYFIDDSSNSTNITDVFYYVSVEVDVKEEPCATSGQDVS